MEIDAAVAKISKIGNPQNGDTVEITERPNGGLSIVMAEVTSNILDKKNITSTIVRKVIGWIGEGIRDGAAARAASDSLFTDYKGQISACLNIISFDKQSDTIVITRNNPSPVYIFQEGNLDCLGGESLCIGDSLNIRPTISEIPFSPNTVLVLYSNGVRYAGKSFGLEFDGSMLIRSLVEDQDPNAEEIANTLLGNAIRLDQNNPKADMSIIAARINDIDTSGIRKMSVFYPFPLKNEGSPL
jgi:hypothetical protein